MKLPSRSSRDYANALQALLPPGDAWRWPRGGTGDALMLATGQEPARVTDGAQAVLDQAIELHRPKVGSWTLADYRREAQAALEGVAETMPRRPFAVGSKVGERLWSHAAPGLTFPVPLVQVDQMGPARVGSHAGNALWSARSRAVLRVRYYRSVVDPAPLWVALAAFKQAHIFLWFEDITGVGGSYAPH